MGSRRGVLSTVGNIRQSRLRSALGSRNQTRPSACCVLRTNRNSSVRDTAVGGPRYQNRLSKLDHSAVETEAELKNGGGRELFRKKYVILYASSSSWVDKIGPGGVVSCITHGIAVVVPA